MKDTKSVVNNLKQTKFLINWKLIRAILLVSLVIPFYFTIYNLINKLPLVPLEFILGYIFTVNVTLVVTYTCSKILNWLMKALPWEKGFSKRLTVELILTNINSSFWVTVILFLYRLILVSPYIMNDEKLTSNVFDHVVIAIIINTIFVLVVEGDYLLKKWRNSIVETEKVKTENERLDKENIQSQFQALKNQVNPHFLFNSLSALGSLIQTNPKKAEEFVAKFSKIYRYVLDVKDQHAVELNRELDFVKAYYFLQKVRYGDNFIIQYDFDPRFLNYFVPPLSLQLLLENVVKHNIISDKMPLAVEIYTDNDEFLVVKNNYQKRGEPVNSNGIGLENLRHRYKILTDLEPDYCIKEDYFIARIPILNDE